MGSSNTTGTTQTITGTVATGDPIAGATVTVQDSLGKTATGTTGTDGTYSIAVTNGTPPFMLVAVPTTGSNLYSVLPAMDMTGTNTQNVNITTITTLVMYELNSGSDPASMYKGLTYSTLTAGKVNSTEVTVRTKLPANSINAAFNTLYGKFVAAVGGNASDPYDMALHGLGKITAYTATGVTLTGTLASYASPTGGGGTAVAGTPSISMSLTDPTTGLPRTSISSSNNALVKTTVFDANGAAKSGAVVTFTTDPVYGAFAGGANTALTDPTGMASVTLTTPNTSGGAATVTATSTVGGVVTTGTVNYAVGASTLSLSPISLPTGLKNGTLSAYGTASVKVTVLNNGAASPSTPPLTVKFTSACATSGKATLTASVTTVNSDAVASYLDNGCNNPSPGDTITATLSNGSTVTGILPVGAPSLGSIQYVSTVTNPATTPPVITLKGTGGATRSETARVTFKVVDSAGNAVGNTPVSFSLNTSLGGLTLSSASATSDPTTGYVVTNVIAGTISTAVRVTATTGALSTQSDQLVISTGIPSQDEFSLSASTHNIEGWNIDGTPTTLTARLADHFKNPVPDGTAVSFTAEGGAVVASCNTVNGVCTSVLTSQALRPTNGRVTVLARATGEEAFVDTSGNGTADAGELVDPNGASSDMPEAWVDYNENGTREANEPYFDFNGSGTYNVPDGLYNGVLCTPGAAICSAQKSIDARGSQTIVFSSSGAVITINGGNTIQLNQCNTAGTGSQPTTFIVTVVDIHGNAMPAGTTVAFSSDNGTPTPLPYTVPDTIGCRLTKTLAGGAVNADGTNWDYEWCPKNSGSTTFMDIPITMKSDATYTAPTPPAVVGTCANTISSGTLTVTVTSPGTATSAKLITTATVGIKD